MNFESAIQNIACNEHENMQALNGLWCNIGSIYMFLLDYGNLNDFNFKKKVFFNVIEYAMSQHWLKLAKNGRFLSGTIKQQVALFNSAFPQSEIDTIDHDPSFFEAWFFSDQCPAEAVWVYHMDHGEIYEERT